MGKYKGPLFASCVNGCDAPVSPPSRVICRACMDKIGETLRDMLVRAKARAKDTEAGHDAP